MGTPKPANADGAIIAGRCRRIGWDVRIGTARAAWDFKITPPKPHAPVYIHKTPSSPRWKTYVMQDLKAAGFDEAEADADRRELAEREAKLRADAEANERKSAKAAKLAAAVDRAAGPLAGPQPLDLAWLLTPTDIRQTRLVIVTPEQAQHILDTANTHNRPLREARWTFLAGCIRRREWAATHQGGAMDSTGVLQDGQHRLRAIAEAGVPVAMQWSVGMPPENFTKVDTNAVRTARDAAALANEADPDALAGAVRLLLNIDRFGPDAHIKARRNPISIDMSERARVAFGPELHAAIAEAKAIKRQIKRANVTAIAVGIFLIRKRLPAGDIRVARFIEDFQYGDSDRTHRKDPVYKLRQLLLQAEPNEYGAWEQLAYVLKAWNHRAKGNQNMEQLVWRQRVESFPHQVFLPPPIADDPAMRVDSGAVVAA